MEVNFNFEENEEYFPLSFDGLQIIDNTRNPVIKPLEVTENGEYTAPENVHGFSPVNVNVPLRYEEGYNDGYKASQDSITLQEKTITENGEFVTDEGFTGMSKVTVAVPIKEEQTKALDIAENGSYDIFPDEGKVLSVASVNVNIPPKEEQEKTVEITANGIVEVVPDEGKTLSKVTANVNVASTGEVGKPYIDTSKMTYFEYFCYKNRLNEQVDKLDTSNGIEFGKCFRGCGELEKITKLDVSKGKYFGECFHECYALESLPPLDISNGQTFYNMFTQCRKLDNVVLTAPKYSLSTNTFSGCAALKNITIGEGWAVNIYLHYSNELTVESLHGMIENLADLTGQTAKIFQVGATNIAKIDEAHIQMLNDKNWTYS